MRPNSTHDPWQGLRYLDFSIRETVVTRVQECYARLPPTASTPARLRELEHEFATSILPDVLGMLLDGLNAYEREAHSHWGISLVVGHCRGLTLGKLEHDQDSYLHHDPPSVGHLSPIIPSTAALPDRLSRGATADQRRRAENFHRIYHHLYKHLFDRRNTINRLMLSSAPLKRRLEIHLGCSHQNPTDYSICFSNAQMEAIAPSRVVAAVSNWACDYYESIGSPDVTLASQKLEAPLSARLAADPAIKRWKDSLATIRLTCSQLGAEMQYYLERLLGFNTAAYPWITPEAAVESLQALAFYRKLGGSHFYTFPTASAAVPLQVGAGVQPSSLVVMSRKDLHPSMQFYLASMSQAIFDAKEVLTIGLLHENATTIRLFNAATHQMDKQLLTLGARLQRHVARREPVPEEYCRRLEQFRRYLRHSVRAVHALTDPDSWRVSRFRLGKVIEDAAAYARLDSYQIQVRTDLDNELRCSGDEDLLWLLLYNLFHNAQRHSVKRNGWIQVSVEVAHGRFTLRVTDSGPGMSEEQRREFFQPSQTGLGRYISLWVVEMHGGTLRIEDPAETADGRMAFRIEIPLNGKRSEV